MALLSEMLIPLIVLLIVVLIIFLLFKLVKKAIFFVLNSIIGLFALFGFNVLFATNIVINFWSVIIVAIGGIIGFVLVLILHFLRVAF